MMERSNPIDFFDPTDSAATVAKQSPLTVNITIQVENKRYAMAKQSKRVRKFNASGGVKARLEKGTMSNKGKLKRKSGKRKSVDDDKMPSKEASSYSAEIRQNREDSDFVSERNLGDMDMESFFTTFADGVNDAQDEDGPDIEVDRDPESDDASDKESEQEDEDEEELVEGELIKVTKGKNSSDDESDSSVEDLEALERQMKEEIGKLKENDPEFHKFLREEDQEMLAYGEGEDDDEEDEEEGNAERGEESEKAGTIHKDNVLALSPELLEKLENSTFRIHSLKALRKLSNAFKSACHLADVDEVRKKSRGDAYQFESSEVFDRLMVVALTRVHEEFHYHLLGKGSTSSKNPEKTKISEAGSNEDKDEEVTASSNEPFSPQLLEKSLRWDDVKPILFTFLKAAIHILSEAKEPDMVVFVLKSLSDYIPYMTPFPRLAEGMLKTLTSLWSAPIDSSEDYQVVRLHSFLRIRQLAMTQPFPFIEECLKKLYLAYAQRAKFATTETSALPTLTFMGNCVVELYSLDYHSSYQHAFIYIRQLALHLRTAMQKKTTEALGAVYCWQYLHCLKLWVAVLTEACQSNDGEGATGEEQFLQSLLFPLTQVIFGTARLIPSTRYLPLRLHCVRLLQQLAAAAEVFLPTTSLLFDVFDLKELSMPPKKVVKSSVQPLAVTLRLRADGPLRTMEELEMCISEVFVLLNREIDLYQYSAGFPEFAVRLCQRLKKVRINWFRAQR
jgi:nucleolar complex protein 2